MDVPLFIDTKSNWEKNDEYSKDDANSNVHCNWAKKRITSRELCLQEKCRLVVDQLVFNSNQFSLTNS